MEATKIFGAGNLPVPLIDAVTYKRYGCTATRTSGQNVAAATCASEACRVPPVQRLTCGGVCITHTFGRRCAGASRRSRRQVAPVNASLRTVAAIAPDSVPPSIVLAMDGVRSPIPRRLQNLRRSFGTPGLGSARTADAAAARAPSKQSMSNATPSCPRTIAFACH